MKKECVGMPIFVQKNVWGAYIYSKECVAMPVYVGLKKVVNWDTYV